MLEAKWKVFFHRPIKQKKPKKTIIQYGRNTNYTAHAFPGMLVKRAIVRSDIISSAIRMGRVTGDGSFREKEKNRFFLQS
jgi:hypothetical protein